MNAIIQSDMFTGLNTPAHLLFMGAKRMDQRFEHQEYSVTQRLALLLIESGVATSPGAIAHDLGHDTGAITRTLNQLEALGLLTRRRETADRRVVALTLTPEGSRIAREFRRSLAELSRSLLKGFEASDVQALVSMLKRLIMALETARPAKNAGFASRLG